MIPPRALSEGRALPVKFLRPPPRKVGQGVRSAAEARRLVDAEIDRKDRAGVPRWRIAVEAGLCERTVYYRLKAIREARAFVREQLVEMAG